MTFKTLRATAVLCLLATPALAQKPDFAPFWSEFSAAAKTGDKTKVRALTKFPFLHFSDLREEKAFDAIWKNLFTAKARACLGKGQAGAGQDRSNYCLFCGETGFYVRANRSWLAPQRSRR